MWERRVLLILRIRSANIFCVFPVFLAIWKKFHEFWDSFRMLFQVSAKFCTFLSYFVQFPPIFVMFLPTFLQCFPISYIFVKLICCIPNLILYIIVQFVQFCDLRLHSHSILTFCLVSLILFQLQSVFPSVRWFVISVFRIFLVSKKTTDFAPSNSFSGSSACLSTRLHFSTDWCQFLAKCVYSWQRVHVGHFWLELAADSDGINGRTKTELSKKNRFSYDNFLFRGAIQPLIPPIDCLEKSTLLCMLTTFWKCRHFV